MSEMEFPDDLKYTKDHEWVRKGDGVYTVGVTAYAVDQLGDITFVELPEVDIEVVQGENTCVVESVKAASDVYSPLTGTIAEVNNDLEQRPELVNQSCYDDGWFFTLEGVKTKELKTLMNAQEYQAYIKEHEE
jgi:glycine cleavage system H protein